MHDPFVLGGVTLRSRLFIGTGTCTFNSHFLADHYFTLIQTDSIAQQFQESGSASGYIIKSLFVSFCQIPCMISFHF